MRRKIHVLSLVGDLLFGGGQNRLLSLASTIDRTQFVHTIVSINKSDTEENPHYQTMHQQYADAGIEVMDLGKTYAEATISSLSPTQVMHTGLVLIRVVQRLIHIVQERQIDIIDAHQVVANLVGVLTGFLTRTRAIVTLYSPRDWESLLLRLPGQFTLGMASAVVTDSQERANDIGRWMIRAHPKIVVIPNGISPPAAIRSANEIRTILGLPSEQETKVIGQVSRLTPYKGHRVLLTAARLVLEKFPHAFFLLIGFDKEGNEYKKQLEQQASAIGIAGRVRIVGYPGAIGDVWQVIDIHAHASLFDSLPNAIIESMSLGKPAVVTATGGIPEIVTHEKTGLVVPPGNPHALSQAILRVLKEPETSTRLGEAARIRYQERYQPETMARKIEELFRELVD